MWQWCAAETSQDVSSSSRSAMNDFPGTLELASTYPGDLSPECLETACYGHASSHFVLAQGREVLIAQACLNQVQLLSGRDASLESTVTFDDAFPKRQGHAASVTCVALGQPDATSTEALVRNL